MRRRRGVRLTAALVATALAGATARAEDGLGGFFQHLFGGPPQQTPASPRPTEAAPTSTPRPVARKRHKPPPPREASAPAAPAAPSPAASKFVYVLGDSLAISAAEGMADELQSKPEIGVIDRARDASGLVRDDYFDWAKAARELAAEQEASTKEPAAKEPAAKARDAAPAPKPAAKVDFVVVMLGINDMQPMRDGKDYIDPLSDRWKEIYAQRVQAVVTPLRAAHIPVVWVGLPPMRAEKFNTQMVALNQLFKDNAERAGAKFLDLFDDFADQGGQFDAFGPNIEGQKVKLRGGDGIHLTTAGGKKLAHFLDVEVLDALDKTEKPKTDIAVLPPDINKATEDINEQIRREMGQPVAPPSEVHPPEAAIAPQPPPKPEAGAINSLAARPASPGAALASASSPAPSEAARLLRRGEPPPAAPGRADDFTR